MSDDEPRIEARAAGPYVATGVSSVTDRDGSALEPRPKMRLCRCGHSAKKPYCDDSHRRIGFDAEGGTPAGRDRLIEYEGREVTVYFNPRLCSHSGECGRIAFHIFNAKRRPWVTPDEGTRDDVEAVINACPSGALSVKGPDGAPRHGFERSRAEVVVQKHGPYWVRGVAPPVEPNCVGMTAGKYVLCRCGKSGNKPFCDGTHWDQRWRDTTTSGTD